MGQDLLHRNARKDIDMLEQGNTDRHQEGDDAAARSITHVEVPSSGDYLPLYNPGGPGPEPFQGVRYSKPSPYDLEPVIIALDDPLRVSNDL